MGQASGKCFSRTAQPHVKMPVRQKAAVQKAVVRGDGDIAPSWEELMARGAPKEVIFDDKAEPEVLNIALVSLDLEEASVKLHGKKQAQRFQNVSYRPGSRVGPGLRRIYLRV